MGRWAATDAVVAAISGDDATVERLLAAIWPGCFRLAAALLGDWNLAQDVAQEACVVVHRKVRGLRSPDAFDAWLYRIVVREASRARRRTRRETLPYAEHFPTDATIALDVWRALAQLSRELREVTVLFYFDDLSGEQIATVLRVPHATVRTRLARARERLRSQLGDYRDDLLSGPLEVTPHAV
jgi:RNA polymerase sigma-70 factor (ECF subfamily)